MNDFRPTYTADLVVLQEDRLLLIKRRRAPFAGMWALPGGKQNSALEPIAQTAIRELSEETGLLLSPSRLLLVDRFDAPGRDPRGSFISIAYLVRLSSEDCPHVQAGDDASEAQWFPLSALPPLAFDHTQIVQTALRGLARTLLTGRLLHDAFRHVEALSPLLGPWEHLSETVQEYYEEVARFVRERLMLCEGCGWQQPTTEALREVADQWLCGHCITPPAMHTEEVQA